MYEIGKEIYMLIIQQIKQSKTLCSEYIIASSLFSKNMKSKMIKEGQHSMNASPNKSQQQGTTSKEPSRSQQHGTTSKEPSRSQQHGTTSKEPSRTPNRARHTGKPRTGCHYKLFKIKTYRTNLI
jgi:hypothetical protein